MAQSQQIRVWRRITEFTVSLRAQHLAQHSRAAAFAIRQGIGDTKAHWADVEGVLENILHALADPPASFGGRKEEWRLRVDYMGLDEPRFTQFRPRIVTERDVSTQILFSLQPGVSVRVSRKWERGEDGWGWHVHFTFTFEDPQQGLEMHDRMVTHCGGNWGSVHFDFAVVDVEYEDALYITPVQYDHWPISSALRDGLDGRVTLTNPLHENSYASPIYRIAPLKDEKMNFYEAGRDVSAWLDGFLAPRGSPRHQDPMVIARIGELALAVGVKEYRGHRRATVKRARIVAFVDHRPDVQKDMDGDPDEITIDDRGPWDD